MRRQGRVISIDEVDGALVELESVAQCSQCSRGQGCGALAFTGASATAPVQIVCATNELSTPSPAVGESVLIDFDESGSSWLWMVFGTYGLPLLAMLIATAFATGFTVHISAGAGITAEQELLIILAAALGLTGGFFAWRLLAPRVLVRVSHYQCLQSARIVGTTPTQRES